MTDPLDVGIGWLATAAHLFGQKAQATFPQELAVAGQAPKVNCCWGGNE